MYTATIVIYFIFITWLGRKPFFSQIKPKLLSCLENKSMFILLYYWIFLASWFLCLPQIPIVFRTLDGELPPRARNQANNPPANNISEEPMAGRHPQGQQPSFSSSAKKERFGAMGRNPHQGRRNQEGHTNDEPRGQRHGQENDNRRRKWQPGGRNRRPPPRSDENFQQWRTPQQKPAEQPQQVKKETGLQVPGKSSAKDSSWGWSSPLPHPGLKELLSHSFYEVQLAWARLPGCSEGLQFQNGHHSVLHVLGMLKNSKFLKVCLPAYGKGWSLNPSLKFETSIQNTLAISSPSSRTL